MLQFSKRLQHKGIKVTFVTTHFLYKSLHRNSSPIPIALEAISNGYDEGGIAQAESIDAYLGRFWQLGPQTLTELVEKMNASSVPVDCIVYDSILPWTLDVAKKFGLLGATFLTQSCAVCCIYYHVNRGLLKLPLTGNDILLPGMPPLEPQDMPSFVYDLGHILLSLIWESEQSKLPENFSDETSQKGLVVNWCPQLGVLAHEATGCFLTHCGWNSTLEALSLGVPMVAMPQWADQSTNSKYIMDVWKMGLKAPADEKGIVRREAIAHCISEILEGERGKEIKQNAGKWRNFAEEAVAKGGSSDKNIDEFVANLVCSKCL
ncbi:Flavonol 7-O-beta-glucosyltransferase UGT74F1 [Citrus sinensis]|nr:Flavonol 7-O-beta-glucosyltransferase UGT74F1 [Citrus sinensis]